MLPEDSIIIHLGELPPEIVHYGRNQARVQGITLQDFMLQLLKRAYERRPGAPFDPSNIETLHDWIHRVPATSPPGIFEGEFGLLSTDTEQAPSEELVSEDT